MKIAHPRCTVLRRARVRDELKPIRADWHGRRTDPDWFVVTHIIYPQGPELYDLQLLKDYGPACGSSSSPDFIPRIGIISWMSYGTLRAALDDASAVLGVSNEDWEVCETSIVCPDGSIDWGLAFKMTEPVDPPNRASDLGSQGQA